MNGDVRDRLLDAAERIVAVEATDLRPALAQAADVVADATGAEKVDVFFHVPATATPVALGVSNTPLARLQQALGLDHQPVANGGRAARTFRTGESFVTGRTDLDREELPGVAGPWASARRSSSRSSWRGSGAASSASPRPPPTPSRRSTSASPASSRAGSASSPIAPR